MDGRSIKEQVISGLALAAKFLFGFATVALFWGAITVITAPERVSPDSFLLRRVGVGTHSVIAGWLCLAVSTAILILTMDRWVKILSGFFLYATFGAVIMLSGHYAGDPVPQREAWFLTLFSIATAIVSWTFRERKLYVIDRIALMIFQTCLALGATPNPRRMFKALTAAFVALLSAWVVDLIRQARGGLRREGHGPRQSASKSA